MLHESQNVEHVLKTSPSKLRGRKIGLRKQQIQSQRSSLYLLKDVFATSDLLTAEESEICGRPNC